MPNAETAVGNLLTKYPTLHKAEKVNVAVAAASKGGTEIPKDRSRRVGTYLDSLTTRYMGRPEKALSLMSGFIIQPENIPQSHFTNELQRWREEGHGNVLLTDEMREGMTANVIEDQKSSLTPWFRYMTDPDTPYPAWFRFYALRSVVELGKFDTQEQKFNKRDKATTAPFVTLNRQALGKVHDWVDKSINGKKIDGIEDNEAFVREVQGANFGKLYARAVDSIAPVTPELLQNTRGEWVRYEGGSEELAQQNAPVLSDATSNLNIDWCFGGAESVAQRYLEMGDMLVYYTGNPTIPRVGISMQDGQVGEVHGIGTGQDIEPQMLETAEAQLAQLPGGEMYLQKAADMKRLTAIERKHRNDELLSQSELRFLWEIDHVIEGFGMDERDPRVNNIQTQRVISGLERDDFATIFDCSVDQVALLNQEYNDRTVVFLGDLKIWALEAHKRDITIHPSLRYVKGNGRFVGSDLRDTGSIEGFGGSVYFSGSKIERTMIRNVRGKFDALYSQLEQADELEYVGDEVMLRGSKVKRLPKLWHAGGDTFDLDDTEVEEAYALEVVKGSLDITSSNVRRLKSLRYVGEVGTRNEHNTREQLEKAGADMDWLDEDLDGGFANEGIYHNQDVAPYIILDETQPPIAQAAVENSALQEKVEGEFTSAAEQPTGEFDTADVERQDVPQGFVGLANPNQNHRQYRRYMDWNI